MRALLEIETKSQQPMDGGVSHVELRVGRIR
jgi:hypothetical protein